MMFVVDNLIGLYIRDPMSEFFSLLNIACIKI